MTTYGTTVAGKKKSVTETTIISKTVHPVHAMIIIVKIYVFFANALSFIQLHAQYCIELWMLWWHFMRVNTGAIANTRVYTHTHTHTLHLFLRVNGKQWLAWRHFIKRTTFTWLAAVLSSFLFHSFIYSYWICFSFLAARLRFQFR